MRLTTHNIERGVDLVELNISELRTLKMALSFFDEHAGTAQRFHAEQAEAMAAQIPDVVYMADRFRCDRCESEIFDDEFVVKKNSFGPHAPSAITCPACGSEKFSPLTRLPFPPSAD